MSTDTERMIGQLLGQLLGLENALSPLDRLVDYGGDSLVALALTKRLLERSASPFPWPEDGVVSGPLAVTHALVSANVREYAAHLDASGYVSADCLPAIDCIGRKEVPGGLLDAARRGDVDLVRAVIDSGASAEAGRETMLTPLHLAAANGQDAVVLLLLANNASPNAKSPFYTQTPLHLCAYFGHADIVDLLVTHGGAVRCRDKLRQTALHSAARGGHCAAVEVLLQRGAGADLAAFDKWQRQPLHWAGKPAALSTRTCART
jgi:hypothetical protein